MTGLPPNPSPPAQAPPAKRGDAGGAILRIGTGAGIILWLAIFLAPLASLFGRAWVAPASTVPGTGAWEIWRSAGAGSILTAALVATVSVLLGYAPGKLAGLTPAGARGRAMLVTLALVAPLLLPPYVLYYGWSVLLAPTAPVGNYISLHPELARLAGSVTATGTMLLWLWPLAALLIAQGWRNIDPAALAAARLDAGPWTRLTRMQIPMLAPALALAWVVCFTLALAEYTTFHLSGLATLGTRLADVYSLTQSPTDVARAAWPMLALSAAVAWWLNCALNTESPCAQADASPRAARGLWLLLAALLAVSLAAPAGLLGLSLVDLTPWRQLAALHYDGLAWSGAMSLAAAAGALTLAATAVALAARPCRWLRSLGVLMQVTMLACALLPASVVAAALLELPGCTPWARSLRAGWWMVSAGLVMRYAGIAAIVLALAWRSRDRDLSELAAVDGATPAQAWRHVHLPRLWPLLAGLLLVLTAMGMTEIPATIMLLPAGVPCFSQRLLDQMHRARDGQVIASCLVLMGAYLAIGLLLVAGVRRAAGASRPAAIGRTLTVLLIVALMAGSGGCRKSDANAPAEVETIIGQTGSGPGEFMYPRAIDLAADGTIFVIDKTARVQHFSADGRFLSQFQMPLSDLGKPTGISVGPDSNLWVADTHYHRVMVYRPDGQLVKSFGQFGREGGQFIFPTDVAFDFPPGSRGRVFVSEYGGNDRVSMFTADGEFISSFGSFGADPGQFNRPAALALDPARRRLYVADACNHRIVRYDLSAGGDDALPRLAGVIGQLGDAPGQLRYPYGLCLLSDGTLVVCEYGNNRIQFFSPEGQSLRIVGQAGREPGQLAFPWAVAPSREPGRLFVVDAGNNRVQVWRR